MSDPTPLSDTHLRLFLPQDVSASDSAAAIDLLSLRVAGTTVHLTNPRALVVGGPGIDSIVFTIVSSGALAYIAGKFLDHVLDEGITHALAKLSAALRRKRRDDSKADEPPWFIWTFTNSADVQHAERLTLVGRFESSDELLKMRREARELIGSYSDAGIGNIDLIWRRQAGKWDPYDPIGGEPDDS